MPLHFLHFMRFSGALCRSLSAVCMLLISATSSAFEWTPECDKSQLSMNVCAAQRLAHFDGLLNQRYAEQMAFLSNEQTRKDLRQAQRAWVSFRDADCLYQVGRREDSGSIWPLQQAMCLAEHTQKRVLELEQYTACRDDGCPH